MKSIVTFLNKRTRREQLLMLGFIAVAALLWTNSLVAQWADLRTDHTRLSQQRKTQQSWTSRKEMIDSQLEASRAALQSELIFTSDQLAEYIDTLARDLGVNCELSSPVSHDGEVFAVHSLSMTIRGETLGSLLLFEDYLLDEAPYLVIREVRLSPTPTDPRLLNASFVVEAFELKEDEPIDSEETL